MKAKGARRPSVAAAAANAALAAGHGEGSAIRIGLAASNQPPRTKGGKTVRKLVRHK